ncbi:MAG: hypothetical protein C0506_14750 [Anaerolinea sp.]|nr:hypothetical protein [Anaerolinea sp.]
MVRVCLTNLRASPGVTELRPTCYPTNMKKTSVYLTEAEVELLRRLAEREGKSQATVLREAIAAYDERALPDRDFAVFESGEGDGRSVADIPEEELMRGFGEQ